MTGTPPLFGIERSSPTSDDYYTPAWVFEYLAIEFDIDVCAPPGGISWIPAKRYYTMADDGLAQPWAGRLWMNPPFSRPAEWVRRFIEHRNGICLVPVSTGRWFRDLWDQVDGFTLYADRAVFARGQDGERGIPLRCLLGAFGDECVEALARLGTVRRIE